MATGVVRHHNLCDESQLKESHRIDIKLTLLLFRSSKDETDHKFKLVTHIHQPYSYTVPGGRFMMKVDLSTIDGEFVRGF